MVVWWLLGVLLLRGVMVFNVVLLDCDLSFGDSVGCDVDFSCLF